MSNPLARLTARLTPPPDGDLLARFVRDRDEEAFAALVRRHGPTVLGVCRRLLGNTADADDAFQAVFLVLVKRAGALGPRPALGGWLHGVAVRASGKARVSFARLRRHERRAAEARPEAMNDAPPADAGWLDRELAALPERLRGPVVACLVQERPRAEVAAELGIPEGTLASRLDAARKRLAERLAQHRLPLAFGGLLVPVPTALATAAANRAADQSGQVIHQLAHEVTRAMNPNTKWVTLAAVGGLAATAVAVRRAAPVPKDSEPPEPAWMANFRKAYELKPGEYVKRVPRPLPPERADFELTHFYKTIGTEREADHRLDYAKTVDFITLFVEQDGRKLSYRTGLSMMGIQSTRPGWRPGDNLLTLWTLLELVTDREEPEITIDPKSKGDPLFDKDNLVASGDFVIRRDAPLDKLAAQLEKILRDECKVGIRLTLKEEEQPVYVVGGTFAFKPPVWREKTAKEVDVYATEDGLNTEYEFAKHDRGRERAKAVRTVTYSGTPTGFVRFVGSRIGTRMVWDVPLPAEPKFQWHNHTVRNPTKEQEATDRDPDKVLKVAADQTGLTFKSEKRKVAVLYVSADEKK